MALIDFFDQASQDRTLNCPFPESIFALCLFRVDHPVMTILAAVAF